MMDGPEACHDIRQYEGKGRHYPMKLLPESSKKRQKKQRQCCGKWDMSLHGPTQGQRNADSPLGVLLVCKSHPQISLPYVTLYLAQSRLPI